ncbi:hypothetical protein [Gloeobacter violaceus]|uniref:Gsl3453 protein n=1 Tax=Gloeobacter violaceus (strain ATCC 29082 / PCC 7421) TaxID=251221 RepID=Q7NFS1_GLOVI|nr:hypothetical protein [Gloeobacter violaceus]BAC91394.1 gsl3453 [Gloeobacter violaceus PCC 7421]
MLDPQIARQILHQHFREVTPEEFLQRLCRVSPELLGAESDSDSARDRVQEIALSEDQTPPTPSHIGE